MGMMEDLTLQDFFAAVALLTIRGDGDMLDQAREAYEMADAMLETRGTVV